MPAIDDIDAYEISDGGIIKGLLRFSCYIGGERFEAEPRELKLELKPFIEKVEIQKIVHNEGYDSYNVHFMVKYWGADYIRVVVEEEDNSVITPMYLYEPYIALGVAEYIAASFYAWIDFTAENQYGKDLYTVEMLPGGIPSAAIDAPLEDVVPGEETETFEVYSIEGKQIGIFGSLEEIKDRGLLGVFIVRQMQDGLPVKTFKVMYR